MSRSLTPKDIAEGKKLAQKLYTLARKSSSPDIGEGALFTAALVIAEEMNETPSEVSARFADFCRRVAKAQRATKPPKGATIQ